MMRELSLAEEKGWRSYWDGWIICPDCIVDRRSYRSADEWGVPADYANVPIGAETQYDHYCCHCRARPPLELTWRQREAA